MVFRYGTCVDCGTRGYKVHKPRKCSCGGDLHLSDNWYVIWTNNGRTNVKAVSTRKQDALDFEVEVRRAIRMQMLLPHQESNIDWMDAVKNFDDWMKMSTIKKSTSKMYDSCIKRLTEAFKGKCLQDITMQEVLAYQKWRLTNLKPATVNREIATLKRIYSLHCDWNSAQKAPRLHLTNQDMVRVKLIPENNLKTRFWSQNECKLLIDSCSNDRIRIVLRIALMTGLRLGNILHLTWDQIADNAIVIPPTQTKSKRIIRLPIPQSLSLELKKYKLSSGTKHFLFSKEGTANWFYPAWYQVTAAAGLEDIVFHEARHTYASHFLMNGGDLATLSELMDHSNINITKQRYGHLSQEHKVDAVNKYVMEV